MIDPATGILTLNPNLILDPTGATGLVPAEGALPGVEEWRILVRWPVYDTAGRKLNLKATTHNGYLDGAQLFYYLPDEPERDSWDNWSYAAEMRRKEQHDMILRETLGDPPYTYSWGSVASVYDAKGGFSEIIIRYT